MTRLQISQRISGLIVGMEQMPQEQSAYHDPDYPAQKATTDCDHQQNNDVEICIWHNECP